MSWETRVKRVIYQLCREAYLKANTSKSGSRYKKHIPYSIPETARNLIDALDRGDEETAKALMLYSYECRNM